MQPTSFETVLKINPMDSQIGRNPVDRNAVDTSRIIQFDLIKDLKAGSQNLTLQVVVLELGKRKKCLLNGF